jgi:hypothetical protein
MVANNKRATELLQLCACRRMSRFLQTVFMAHFRVKDMRCAVAKSSAFVRDFSGNFQVQVENQ